MRLPKIVFAVFVLPLSDLTGQRASAAFSGSVVTDSTRRPIPHAAVAIPALRKTTSTDEEGRFRFADLKPGSYEIVVRRIGFAPYNERLRLRADENFVHEIRLVPVVVLDSVTVTASSLIPSFEEHRALGIGSFIGPDELAKQESRRLSEVIAQLRGVRVVHGASGLAWLAGGRGPRSLNPRTCGMLLDEADVRMKARKCECYAQVYLGNSMVYRGHTTGQEPLFNLNSVPVHEIYAIEYYAGPSQTPLEYSKLNSGCGVLVIHLKR